MVKFNYLIEIEYDGTNFVGWQYQKNGKSIQEKIEKVLKKILKSKIKIIGAGRTDKGVHAFGQFANFITEKEIEKKNEFINSINFFLNKSSISIISIKKKKLEFHSRHSAKERIYEYKIINRQGSLSLEKNKAWHIKKKLDVNLLKKGAKILEGKHDFSTFRSSSCSSKSPIKKMNSVIVKKNGDKIIIIFRSRSFLQNQVRSMVGCLKYLSSYNWDLEKFISVLRSKNRKFCAPPAPANGLYLKKVIY
jgi:tRNA pseudouridine38-40 synthase